VVFGDVMPDAAFGRAAVVWASRVGWLPFTVTTSLARQVGGGGVLGVCCIAGDDHAGQADSCEDGLDLSDLVGTG
jgi:hypothetical protein